MASEMDTFLFTNPDLRDSLSQNTAVPPSIMAPELYDDYRTETMEYYAMADELLKQSQTATPTPLHRIQDKIKKRCTQALFFEPVIDILVYAKTAVRLVDDNWDAMRSDADGDERVDGIIKGFIIEVAASYKSDYSIEKAIANLGELCELPNLATNLEPGPHLNYRRLEALYQHPVWNRVSEKDRTLMFERAQFMHTQSTSIRAQALRIANIFNETMDNLIALHAVKDELASGAYPSPGRTPMPAQRKPNPKSKSEPNPKSTSKPKFKATSRWAKHKTDLHRIKLTLEHKAQLSRTNLQNALAHIESIYATLIHRREVYVSELTALRTFVVSRTSRIPFDRAALLHLCPSHDVPASAAVLRRPPAVAVHHPHSHRQVAGTAAQKPKPKLTLVLDPRLGPALPVTHPRSPQTPNLAQDHIPSRGKRGRVAPQPQPLPPSPPQSSPPPPPQSPVQSPKTATAQSLLDCSDDDSDDSADTGPDPDDDIQTSHVPRFVSFANNPAWNHTPAPFLRRQKAFRTDGEVWEPASPSLERAQYREMEQQRARERKRECPRTHPPALGRRGRKMRWREGDGSGGVDGAVVERGRVKVKVEEDRDVSASVAATVAEG